MRKICVAALFAAVQLPMFAFLQHGPVGTVSADPPGRDDPPALANMVAQTPSGFLPDPDEIGLPKDTVATQKLPKEPESYEASYQTALAQNRPLIVWVGCWDSDLVEKMKGCIHCRRESFVGAKKGTVIISLPDPKCEDLYRVKDSDEEHVIADFKAAKPKLAEYLARQAGGANHPLDRASASPTCPCPCGCAQTGVCTCGQMSQAASATGAVRYQTICTPNGCQTVAIPATSLPYGTAAAPCASCSGAGFSGSYGQDWQSSASGCSSCGASAGGYAASGQATGQSRGGLLGRLFHRGGRSSGGGCSSCGH